MALARSIRPRFNERINLRVPRKVCDHKSPVPRQKKKTNKFVVNSILVYFFSGFNWGGRATSLELVSELGRTTALVIVVILVVGEQQWIFVADLR